MQVSADNQRLSEPGNKLETINNSLGDRLNAPLPAVVAWLDNNVGLELSRILSERGVPVIALAVDARNYRCKTRYVERVIEVATGDSGLVTALESLRPSIPKGAIFCPTTDGLAQIASENQARLASHYRMAIADQNSLRMLGDKEKVDALARKAGVSVPQTWVVSTATDIEVVLESCTFPLIVKPSIRTDAWWEAFEEKALKVDDQAQLSQVLESSVALAPSLIVQEWIEGGDANMFFYLSYFGSAGSCLAELVGQKIRQWPPLTGVGSSSMQVDAPGIIKAAHRLIGKTNFRGFCEIEFKRREGTDDFYLIEANVGRPSLHASLAESSGIEMQCLMYCDCAGMPLPAGREVSHPGAKCVVWRFELQAAWMAIKSGELSALDWIIWLKGRIRSVDIHFADRKVIWAGFVTPAVSKIIRRLRMKFSLP